MKKKQVHRDTKQAPPPPASSDWPGSFPVQPEHRCHGDGPPESPCASSPAAPPAEHADSAPPLWTSPALTHADRGSQREGGGRGKRQEQERNAETLICQVLSIKYLYNPASPVLQTALSVLQTALPAVQTALSVLPVLQTALPVHPVPQTAPPVLQTALPVLQTALPVRTSLRSFSSAFSCCSWASSSWLWD